MDLYHRLRPVFRDLIRLDNPFDESSPIQRGIKSANDAARDSLFFGIIGSLVFYFWLPNPYIWISFVCTLGYLCTYLFNYLKWYRIAQASPWMCSAISFFVLSSIYGYDSGFHYLNIVILLAILFKHQDDILPTVLPIITLVVCVVILYLTDFSLFHWEFKPEQLKIANNYCFFSCLGSCIFISINVLADAEKKRKKIVLLKEAEQKVLRSQMNPHFIFNVLNSIQSYILENNSEDAVRFLGKFSQLIRKVLQHSKSPTISLADELSALELYLQLEKFRLSQGLVYEIIIDTAIQPEKTLIPPIIFQPIVENAIWHGIAPCKRKGTILINIQKKGNIIVCTIEDNGMGIIPKKKDTKHESIGLTNIKERLSHFAHQHHTEAEIYLYNNEGRAGACLRFSFPYIIKKTENSEKVPFIAIF